MEVVATDRKLLNLTPNELLFQQDLSLAVLTYILCVMQSGGVKSADKDGFRKKFTYSKNRSRMTINILGIISYTV
jgi:hypothetical protein